jgi:DNA-binding transcriptional LysR family regulator
METVVVCAKDNELVSTGPVSIRQLARLTWVLTKPGNYSCDLIDQIVLSSGLAPLAPLIEAQSFESSLSVVAATRIISIAPESAARRYEELGLIRTVQLRPALRAHGRKAECAAAGYRGYRRVNMLSLRSRK